MKKILLFIALFFTLSSVAMAAYKHQTIASAMIKHSNFVEIQKNIFVSPNTTSQQKKALLELIASAKKRIKNKFGEFTATPIIISSNDIDKLRYYVSNSYGAAHFTLSNAYIILGPNGQNIDVVSHELVHSEIYTRIGYFNRWLKLPVWFDEGVAMQVDHRKVYNNPPKTIKVKQLKYGWQFFSGNQQNHYAVAKHEVKKWLNASSDTAVYDLLTNIKNGGSFKKAYNNKK